MSSITSTFSSGIRMPSARSFTEMRLRVTPSMSAAFTLSRTSGGRHDGEKVADRGLVSPQHPQHRFRIELSLYGHALSELTGLLQKDTLGAAVEGRPFPVREGAFPCGFAAGSIDGDNRFTGGADMADINLTTARPLPMASRSTATMTS